MALLLLLAATETWAWLQVPAKRSRHANPAPSDLVAAPVVEVSDRFPAQPESPAGAAKKPDKGKKGKKDDFRKNVPPGWHADYAQALEQARRTGQPLLVLFH